jgi:hypothetical protein
VSKFIVAFLFVLSTCHMATADVVCVHVLTMGGGHKTGSAVVLDTTQKGLYVALTARHVVEGQRIVWLGVDKKWIKATYCNILQKKTGFDQNFDAALLFFESTKKFERQTYSLEAKIGDKCWLDGFPGGKEANFIEGELENEVSAITDTPPIRGQSGGAVYDDDNNLIGIVNTTNDGLQCRVNQFGQWETIPGKPRLGFTPITHIKEVCDAEFGFFWGIGVCPPGGCPPPRYRHPPQYVQPYPMQPRPDLGPPVAPPPDSVRPSRTAEIDYDKLTKLVIENLDIEALRGPQGPPGNDGMPGSQGAPGAPADEARVQALEKIVPSLYDEIMALKSRKDLTQDVDQLKAEIDRLRYTQIPVQFIDKDGTVFDRVNVRLDKRIPYDDPKLINSATLKMKKSEKEDDTTLEKDESAESK